MAEEGIAPREVDLHLVARIVRSYARHQKIGVDQLPGLIAEIHRTLDGLGHAAPPVEEPPKPAVPIRRSVQQDYVVCLDCGFRARTLSRHLRVAHGLGAAGYRARWKLPSHHPLTAPGYSAQRSAMAKQIGLGQREVGKAAAPSIGALPPAKAEEHDAAFAASLSEPKKRRGRRPRTAVAE
jgi:predicted transcriptional regulator